MPDQDMFPDQEPLPASSQKLVAGQLAHLRPTTPLELLDRIFSVVAGKPFVFAGLALLFAGPLLLVDIAAIVLKLQPNDPYLSAARILILLLQQWPAAALVVASFQSAVFPHKKLSLLLALRASVERLPYFILTRILAFAIIFSLALLPFSLILTSGAEALGPFQTMVAVWAFFAAIYFLVLWALLPIVVMVEHRAFVRAMMRSAELMRGVFRAGWIEGDTAFRRLTLMAIVPAVLWVVAQVVLQLCSLSVSGNLTMDQVFDTRVAVLSMGLSFVVGSVLAVVAYAGLALLYMECRIRREALDLQVRLLANGHLQLEDESFENIDS